MTEFLCTPPRTRRTSSCAPVGCPTSAGDNWKAAIGVVTWRGAARGGPAFGCTGSWPEAWAPRNGPPPDAGQLPDRGSRRSLALVRERRQALPRGRARFVLPGTSMTASSSGLESNAAVPASRTPAATAARCIPRGPKAAESPIRQGSRPRRSASTASATASRAQRDVQLGRRTPTFACHHQPPAELPDQGADDGQPQAGLVGLEFTG